MKRLVLVFLFALTSVVILAACSPARAAAARLMDLPDEGRLLVLSLVTAGVMWLLLWLSARFNIDLSGYANAVAVALAPIIVTIIEAGLRLIPPAFDNIVLTVIHMIVLLVGSIGTFFLFQRRAPSLR